MRAGALVRIRHGVYVDGADGGDLKTWQKYRLRIQAAAEMFAEAHHFCQAFRGKRLGNSHHRRRHPFTH